MRLIQYKNPFDQEIEQLNRMFNWAFPFSRATVRASSYAPVDFYENEEGYRIEVDLPGFSKEQVRLEQQDGSLVLKAEQGDSEKDAENRRNVERTIKLPDDVAFDKIQAKLTNGVLEVTLPRREELKPARIEIK